MNELYIVGDVHGRWTEYEGLLAMFGYTPSIQLGDMGIGFHNYKHPKSFRANHRFFRGNHDNPEECQNHPNYMGDYGYRDEWKLAWVSGAWSIDWASRTPGISWWNDEELPARLLKKLPAIWTENQPRIIVTHDAPSSLYPSLVTGLIHTSRTSHYLDQALTQTKWVEFPKYWFFGHHHRTAHYKLPDIPTEFICIGELDFVKLDVDKLELL